MDTKKEALYKKVLKEVNAGSTQADACKKYGVPRSTFSNWKVHGNGRKVTDPKVEREVEEKATTKKVARKKQGNDISVVVFKGDSKAIAKALKGVL